MTDASDPDPLTTDSDLTQRARRIQTVHTAEQTRGELDSIVVVPSAALLRDFTRTARGSGRSDLDPTDVDPLKIRSGPTLSHAIDERAKRRRREANRRSPDTRPHELVPILSPSLFLNLTLENGETYHTTLEVAHPWYEYRLLTALRAALDQRDTTFRDFEATDQTLPIALTADHGTWSLTIAPDSIDATAEVPITDKHYSPDVDRDVQDHVFDWLEYVTHDNNGRWMPGTIADTYEQADDQLAFDVTTPIGTTARFTLSLSIDETDPFWRVVNTAGDGDPTNLTGSTVYLHDYASICYYVHSAAGYTMPPAVDNSEAIAVDETEMWALAPTNPADPPAESDTDSESESTQTTDGVLAWVRQFV